MGNSAPCCDTREKPMHMYTPLPRQYGRLPFNWRQCRRSTCKVCCVLFLVLLAYALVILLLYTSTSRSNGFQKWALAQPGNPVARLFLPTLEFVESMDIGQTQKLTKWRHEQGVTFAAAGMVWLSRFEDVREAIRLPQARTHQLGEHPLLSGHLPAASETRNVFLLSLSDAGAGGDGSHEAFRRCFIDTLLEAPAARQRRVDSVATRLMETLEADYRELPHESWRDAFFSDSERGLTHFASRFLHYVMFGVNPDDAAVHGILNRWYTGELPISYYLWPIGWFLPLYAGSIDEVARVYEQSPAFQDFQTRADYHHMTPRELALLCTSIMRLAGVQGFQQMAKIVLGGWTLGGSRQYPESPTEAPINQKVVWDSLDLSNTTQVRLYVTECVRLDAPVSVTHHVATQDFEVFFSDNLASTYPAGTKIAIPIALAHVDPLAWGTDTYEFDLNRPHLEENFMGFNGLGTEGGRRECPAKALVMDTLIHIVQRLGQVRQRSLDGPAATASAAPTVV